MVELKRGREIGNGIEDEFLHFLLKFWVWLEKMMSIDALSLRGNSVRTSPFLFTHTKWIYTSFVSKVTLNFLEPLLFLFFYHQQPPPNCPIFNLHHHPTTPSMVNLIHKLILLSLIVNPNHERERERDSVGIVFYFSPKNWVILIVFTFPMFHVETNQKTCKVWYKTNKHEKKKNEQRQTQKYLSQLVVEQSRSVKNYVICCMRGTRPIHPYMHTYLAVRFICQTGPNRSFLFG